MNKPQQRRPSGGGPGRRPDYNVSAMDKESDRLKGQVGAAWTNDDGSISIRLNPFVVLDTREHALEIRLFPNDREGGAPYAEPAGGDGPPY